MVEKVRPSSVERRPSMTSAAELRDQMLNRRTSSATEAQAMRERNVDADMLNRQEMRERNVDADMADRERMTKGEAAPAPTDVEESPDDETDLAELTARRNWKKNLPEKDDVPKTESVEPRRVSARIEMADPIWMKSRRLRLDPRRFIP